MSCELFSHEFILETADGSSLFGVSRCVLSNLCSKFSCYRHGKDSDS